MKTFIKYMAVCACALALACGCNDLSELSERVDDLESRVTALETQIESLNGNVEALQALAGGGTIRSVSQQGDTYTIETSNGSTLVIKQGSVGIGNAPIMSIDKDGWWMADYQDGKGPQYVLQNGQKVMAVGQDGIAPRFGVDAEGYWTVSYDGGTNFTRVLGADGKPVLAIASGEATDSYFSDVKVQDEKLVVTLRNGEAYSIPVISDFYCIITCGEEADEYKYNDAKSYPVEMSGVASTVVTAPDGWRAVLSENSLKVVAPSDPTKATIADSKTDVSIIAFSASGYGTVAKVHVKLSGDPSHDAPVASVTAGESTVTSVSFNVKVEDATEWYYLILPASAAAPGLSELMAGTKCTEMTRTLTADAESELTQYTCYVLPVNGTTFGTIVSATATSAAYSNRYEAYQAGKTITIGGKPYSKAVNGEATLISADVTWNESAASNGGVFFIADGVTLTCAACRPKASVIILGEKPGTNGNLVFTGTFIPQAENLEFVFNSLNISIKKNALLYGAKTVTKVGFYSCRMEYVGLSNFSLSATSKIQSAEYVGCDIKISSASIGIFDGKLNVVKINSIVFNDNILYPDTSGRTYFFFRQSRAGITDTVGSVEIRNNTIYDVSFAANGLCSPKSVDSFCLENNIFAYSAQNDGYQRCLWLSGDPGSSATAVDGYPSEGSVKNNLRYNTLRVFGVMSPSVNLDGMSWYPDGYQEVETVTENPFATVDAANGIFTTKSAYSNYGAHR